MSKNKFDNNKYNKKTNNIPYEIFGGHLNGLGLKTNFKKGKIKSRALEGLRTRQIRLVPDAMDLTFNGEVFAMTSHKTRLFARCRHFHP